MNKQLKNNKLLIYSKNLTSCRLSCLVDQTLSLDQHYPETVQPKWEKIIEWVRKEYGLLKNIMIALKVMIPFTLVEWNLFQITQVKGENMRKKLRNIEKVWKKIEKIDTKKTIVKEERSESKRN